MDAGQRGRYQGRETGRASWFSVLASYLAKAA
jgi:hypothetical protein